MTKYIEYRESASVRVWSDINQQMGIRKVKQPQCGKKKVAHAGLEPTKGSNTSWLSVHGYGDCQSIGITVNYFN